LSYCWGVKDRPNIATTKENLDLRRSSGFRWDDVPKTLQDAITISRALEIDYLWIDMICIVQDDNDNWSEQAAEMADI
jgi:hypothetical protein